MRTDNGTTDIEIEESINTEDYIMSINYPNPFNPNTKIRISIPYGIKRINNLSLKIFDITGKEIKTLYNNFIQPGTYEFD